MNKKNLINRISLVAVFTLNVGIVLAQDIHFTQFESSPLVLNPAFTGMFDGSVRAAAIYRNQWQSVTVPYTTVGASIDMPIKTENNGDYLAGGLQLYKDQAGDGALTNFTGLASVAYHKALGSDSRTTGISSSDLAVGLQGGYAQKSIDLSKLYFGDEFFNGTYVKGTSQEWHLGIGNSVNYYIVNAGVCFSHSSSSGMFNYTIGAAANNLNQPNDAIEKKQNSQTGLDMRFTGVAGADWKLGERLMLRPAVLYQYQATANEIIVGNEFHYVLSGSTEPEYANFTTAAFLGLWYRTVDATMLTVGVEYKGLRIGVAYDYNISTLNSASNGNGGYEIAVRYVAPFPIIFADKRSKPCIRF